MKKLFALLVTAAAAVTVGCGSSSLAPVPYVSRASSNNWAPQIYTFNPTNNQSTAVNITLPTDAVYVAVTRDASLAAYTEYVNGSGGNGYNIYSLGTSGTAKQLTTNGESWSPAFSPDGKTIAYYAPDPTTGSNQIFTMNADGSNQTELYSDPTGDTEAYMPYFSPDGKTLSFYVYYNSGGAVATRNANIQPPFGMQAWPTQSYPEKSHPAAKGSMHAMVTASPTASGWYTMSLTGTAPTLVYATSSWWGPASFSADGKQLFIAYNSGSAWNIGGIAIGSLPSSSVTALTTNTTGYTFGAVPYGNMILYSHYDGNTVSFYTMDTTGGNQTQVVAGTSEVWLNFIDSYWGD